MSSKYSTNQTSGDSARELPETVVLTYIAEGAANIVFRISHKDDGQIDERFQGTLLRLRKDLPTTPRTLMTQLSYLNDFAPIFPKQYLLGQEAVQLPPRLISQLNIDLSTIPRPPSRSKDVLAPESHGLLISDMSSTPHKRLVEFKPKWLLQSPTAPRNSTRCRTCALRQRRNSLEIKTAASSKQPSGPPGYCPLDIVSDDIADIRQAAFSILFPNMRDTTDLSFDKAEQSLWSRFVEFIRETEILKILSKSQELYDNSDTLFEERLSKDDSRSLRMAYTLRDCSIFVLIPESEDREIVARVGDLDLKSEAKVLKWREMERELIDEGWYTGTAKVGCALERY